MIKSTETIIISMIFELNRGGLNDLGVIFNGSPIISFGDFHKSKVATLGLNPSDKEFFDFNNNELDSFNRRFHTLKSLDIQNWENTDNFHIKKILYSSINYFHNNPYDRWFKPLNYIISGTGYSYYDSIYKACHLDLFPYATYKKWGDINEKNKQKLLEIGLRFLVDTINNSEIEVLILNGKSVVSTLEKMVDIEFEKNEVSDWNLTRKNGYVRGESYVGIIKEIGDKKLIRPIKILGFNHNIQSSFGVTNKVKDSIKSWIEKEAVL